MIDVANDKIDSKDYKPEEDPKLYHSEKTGRGPLTDPQWIKKVEPVMTCYKLVYIEFKWFGLQSRVESFIAKTVHNLFLKFHRFVTATLACKQSEAEVFFNANVLFSSLDNCSAGPIAGMV